MGKVVVLIPTFNRPEMLRESIESVLAQTYSDFELHLGLDGVAEPVRRVALSFRDRSNVFVHDFPENRGTFATLEDLLSTTESTYVSFFSDDDLMEPTFLGDCVAELARSPGRHPYAYSHIYYWHPDRLEFKPECGRVNLNAVVFVRAYLDELIRRHGFCFEPAYRRYYADAVLLRRLDRMGAHLHVCSPLVRWRIHPGQNTKSVEISLRQILEQSHALHMSGLPYGFRELLQRMQWLVGRKAGVSRSQIRRALSGDNRAPPS